MKIKFDANISPHLITAIRSLERDTSLEISSVQEDYAEGVADPDWMFRFRDAGGDAMVSGDHQILQNPVNLAAYTESGLVSIWPAAGWPKLKRWGQAALLIRWWPTIKTRIAASKSGDRWRVPMSWTPNLEAFEVLRDPRNERP